VPASIDPLIECTVATQDLSAYPGGKDFLAAYKAKYGNANPDPYSIYGYAATQLALHAIAAAGAGGDNKADVVKALFATKDYKSVLGTFSINSDGDTTIKSYGLYKVGSSGDPVFDKTLAPTKTVH
jgi:branched-chain amino acid transport system substrate-binding protein